MSDKHEELGFDISSKKYVDAIFALEKAGFKENEILQLKSGKKKDGWFSFDLPNGNVLKVEQKTGKVENAADLKKIHNSLNLDALAKGKARLRNELTKKFETIGLTENEARKVASTLRYNQDYKLTASCYGYPITGRVLAYLYEPGTDLPQSVKDQLTIKWIVDWAFEKAKMHQEKWKNHDMQYIDSAEVLTISTHMAEDRVVYVHVHEIIHVVNKDTGKDFKCHMRMTGKYNKDNDAWSKELENCFENYFYNNRLIDNIAVSDVITDTATLTAFRDKYIRRIQGALHEVTVDDLKQIKNADNDIFKIIYLLGGCNIQGNGKKFSNEYLRRVPGKNIVLTGLYKEMPYRYNLESNMIYLSKDEKDSIPVGKFIFLKKLVRTWKKMNQELYDSDNSSAYKMYMLDNKDGNYRGKLVQYNANDKIVDEQNIEYPIFITK